MKNDEDEGYSHGIKQTLKQAKRGDKMGRI